MGFSQAVSGLNAASSNLDVIGNNIANSATVGFKSARTSFADVFAASAVGLGVTVAAVTQDFSDGTVSSTGVGTDVAISGNGFYRLVDENGSVYYTRNGEFGRDSEGNFINHTNGLYLTGYSATNGIINAGAEPTKLTISTSAMAASATTSGTVRVNLNSSSSILDPADLDTTDSSTYSYTQTLTTYDSLGNTHNIALYFIKSAENTFDVYAQDTSDSTVTTPTSVGKLVFTSSGVLDTSGTNSALASISTNTLNGSAANTFTLDFTGSTQQNSSNSTTSKNQDGFTAGTLSSYTINNDGTISGTYSNSKTQLLGQIVLASFTNTGGLKSEGDNRWSATANSGEAILGTAGSGTFGTLTSGALESSNVELSRELVNLIVAQRNYQSNAQTIKTQDAILNTLVNLR